ncbi:putative phage head-tail adaptor [Selenomonas sp. oral taxon 892 str. F0426]|uniref:phage head closure protein n=1 Tax=Selenomonas sp. oral taxon 892 TaxID=1321785 RepID=UPI0003ACE454|nr:phage head closure protein [Selenomonas sp. oral taxon 892]ERJ93254.1 putative phage head-tail adaptor [Selenomonas sp. oral taxon 892 str. F0426]
MQVSMSELRHRISILRPVMDTDDEGNILAQTTQKVGKAWALVLPFAAKISDGYAEKVQEVDYRIVIRYRTDVRVTDRIRWDGKTLIPIAPPYPLGGKKQWLVIECRELVEDG